MLVLCAIIVSIAAVTNVFQLYAYSRSESVYYGMYSEALTLESFRNAVGLSMPNFTGAQYQDWLGTVRVAAIEDGLNLTFSGNEMLVRYVEGIPAVESFRLNGS
jgi:hypothetical protein